MSSVNCLVVDDEPLARQIIDTYVQGVPGWRTVASCINAVEAYDALQAYPVDVMFLDIRMPVVSGVEFLKSLPHRPLVVFTTAYADHAAAGFDLDAVDYLVKPITKDRFQQAVAKLLQLLTLRDRPVLAPADFVFIRQDTRLVRVSYDDILYIEARRDFTDIHLRDRKLLAGMHLKALEGLLASQRFMRVHRSFVVNLDAIGSIEGNSLTVNGRSIPIGANFKPALFRQLGL